MAIGEDLYFAIANYEIFAPSAQDATLIERVNEKGSHAGFNVVSEALQLTVISALCRIWDKTSDAARMAEIARRLRKRPELASDPKELERWLMDVERVEGSEELRALRGFRNVGLSHRHDPNQRDPRILSGTRRVVHGDERVLLNKTVSIVERLNALIGVKDPLDFFGEREAWRQRAETFWRSVQ
jgi:hypothetical protein